MSKQRDHYRTAAPKARMTPMPERRLALSGLIRHTLLAVADREQQRGRLLTALILAQALLTLTIAPAYVGTANSTPQLAALGGTLMVYVAALLANRAFHRAATAAYLLVFGGIAGIISQAIILALLGTPGQVAQSTLLFIPVILEAGLLFAPEVTLITAGITTTLTAFVILLSLALTPTLEKHEAYLLVIYSLGLQALAGLIAWLLSQFIFESAVEAQRGQEMQFAQARLEALSSQVADQQERLDQQIGAIQAMITGALAGEYRARIDPPQGELAPLAASLSLLLERVQAVTQAEKAQSRMHGAALPVIDLISRMGDGTTPTPSSLPIMTNTPFDSVSAVVSQMQVNVAHRLTRVQQLIGDVVGGLNHSHEGLSGASEAVQEAQRIAGALIATTEGMLATTNRELGLIVQVRRMLSAALPEEITRQAPGEASHRKARSRDPGSSLLGLGRDLGIAPGYTSEFDVVRSESGDTSGIAPLTVPLPIVDLMGSAAPQDGTPGNMAELAPTEHTSTVRAAGKDDSAQVLSAELVEVWNLAQQLDAEAAQLERAVSTLGRELGVQSRHLRTADAGIAWSQGALEAVHVHAEQLLQLAGPNLPPPPAGEAVPSRPLTQEERLPVSGQSHPSMPDETHPRRQGGKPAEGTTLEELASLAEAFPPREEEPEGPATGSLRARDLLMFDDDDPLPFSFDTPPGDIPRDSNGS